MSFSVLVVEDNREWSDALCEMYEDLLASEDPVVLPALTVSTARRMLKSRSFDLMSLDINLSEHDREEGDGRTLVREASELNAVGGLVVVTGMAQDEELDVIMPEEEIPEARLELGVYLDTYFSGRYLHFPKPEAEDRSAEEGVRMIRSKLTRARMLKISGARNIFHREGQLWYFQYAGKEARVKDKAGMRSIHLLLQRYSRGKPDVSMQDLDRHEDPSVGGATMSKGQRLEEGLGTTTGDYYDPELKSRDERRLREIEKELKAIEARRQEAEDTMLMGQAAVSADDFEKLDEREKALKKERGELRKGAEPPEVKKVRDRVRERIRRSIEAIREVHPDLADHLERAVDTGKTCSYKPDEPVEWSL